MTDFATLVQLYKDSGSGLKEAVEKAETAQAEERAFAAAAEERAFAAAAEERAFAAAAEERAFAAAAEERAFAVRRMEHEEEMKGSCMLFISHHLFVVICHRP